MLELPKSYFTVSHLLLLASSSKVVGFISSLAVMIVVVFTSRTNLGSVMVGVKPLVESLLKGEFSF